MIFIVKLILSSGQKNIYLLKAAHDQKDPSLTDGSFFNFGLIKLFYTENSLEIMDNRCADDFSGRPGQGESVEEMPVSGFEEARAEVNSQAAGGFREPVGGGAIEGFGGIPQGGCQQVALGHEFGKQRQLHALGLGLFGHCGGASQVFQHFAILTGDLGGGEGECLHS